MPRNTLQGNMQDIVGGDYKNLLKDIKEDINKWKEIYSWAETKISRETSVLYQDTIDSSKITPKIVLFYYYYFLRFWQDDYKTWKSKDVKIWREIRCSICLLHSWPRAPEQCNSCHSSDFAKTETKEPEEPCRAHAASVMGEGRREGAHRRGPRHLALYVGNKGREKNKGRKGLHSSLTFHIDLQRIKGWNVEGNVLSQTECLSDLRATRSLKQSASSAQCTEGQAGTHCGGAVVQRHWKEDEENNLKLFFIIITVCFFF